ncbi:MAG TPA: glycosyltransferase [Methylomirabilota bacterium]|nr:glycosyltransferase [Methylomirabilota bacterium]
MTERVLAAPLAPPSARSGPGRPAGSPGVRRFRRRSLEEWKDLAIEALWMVSPPAGSAGGPAWPLDREDLRAVTLRWPARYEWPLVAKSVDPLRASFRRYVAVEVTHVPQPYQGVVMLQWVRGRTVRDVALDYSDSLDLHAECARRSDIYFKMQCLREGYGERHVLPAGFVPGHAHLYRFLPRLRAARDRQAFAYDVHGRFGHEFAREVRERAVGILSAQPRFRYEGGLGRRRYSRFLREVAQARVCIDLPGNGDFCFRLVDYLAVGACVIGPRHRTVLPAPLVDGRHVAFTKDDLSDLVDLCAFYVDDAGAREEMCRQSRAYFDRYLHRDQLVAYYVSSCQERLT